MIIKGQNLRLYVQKICVAAATNAQVHVSLEVQEDSTKDTIDDWLQQSPVGLSWDAQTDAMVDMQPEASDNVNVTKQIQGGYIHNSPITLRPGDGIAVTRSANQAKIMIFEKSDTEYQVIAAGEPSVNYLNRSDNDKEVYVGADTQYVIMHYEVGDVEGAGLSSFIKNVGAPVLVKFATTQPMIHRNRSIEHPLLQGTAIIADIQVNAPNQDITTYSVKLQGTGELEIIEEEE